MTTNRDFDQLARAWLDLMPDEAPDRMIANVRLAVDVTPQQRRWRRLAFRKDIRMQRSALIAAVAIVGTALLGGAIVLTNGPAPTATPASGTREPASPTIGVTVAPRTAAPRTPAPASPTTGVPVAPLGVFNEAGQMSVIRTSPLVVSLGDGRILIAGGRSGAYGSTSGGPPAEIFDPSLGQSTKLTGDSPSGSGSGALLRDGRVLLIADDPGQSGTAAWLMNADHDAFVAQAGSSTPKFGVYATLLQLQDGRVFLSGGQVGAYADDLSNLVMAFDPLSSTFVGAGRMTTPRRWHSATELGDGSVLLVGGEFGRRGLLGSDDNRQYDGSAEIFDLATGTSTAVGGMSVIRGATLAQVLPGGRVLVVPAASPNDVVDITAGYATRFDGSVLRSELYDRVTGGFLLGPDLPGPVTSVCARAGGYVLLVGERRAESASGPGVWQTWSAVYDPATGALRPGERPEAHFAEAVCDRDGSVFFVGGFTDASVSSGIGGEPTRSIQRYQ